jgi:hypothetical protein
MQSISVSSSPRSARTFQTAHKAVQLTEIEERLRRLDAGLDPRPAAGPLQELVFHNAWGHTPF